MSIIRAQNNQRNAANDGWDIIHHETEASVVLYSDGTNVESNYIRQPGYGTTTGIANTYVLTLSPAPTALVDGLAICAKINILNTGASTINVNGLGAKSILDSKGNAMSAGKLKANTPYTMRYNGTNFILQGEGSSGNATAADLILSKTASTDVGEITGTLALTGTAVAADILVSKTAYNTDPKTKITGTMANNGAVAITPSTVQQAIVAGYHNGSGYVVGDVDLIGANIIPPVNIFGVQGTFSNIKSLQTFEVSYTNQTYQTITVSSVDVSKSIVKVTPGSGHPSQGGRETDPLVILVNSTTISIQTPLATTTALTFLVTLIEFNNVKSKQSGTTALWTTNPYNIAVSSVNINKCLIEFSHRCNQGTMAWNFLPYEVFLSTSTNLRIAGGAYDFDALYWQILEFN